MEFYPILWIFAAVPAGPTPAVGGADRLRIFFKPVSVSVQISNNRCRSVEFRASRETSRPSTISALPRLTWVTSF